MFSGEPNMRLGILSISFVNVKKDKCISLHGFDMVSFFIKLHLTSAILQPVPLF